MSFGSLVPASRRRSTSGSRGNRSAARNRTSEDCGSFTRRRSLAAFRYASAALSKGRPSAARSRASISARIRARFTCAFSSAELLEGSVSRRRSGAAGGLQVPRLEEDPGPEKTERDGGSLAPLQPSLAAFPGQRLRRSPQREEGARGVLRVGKDPRLHVEEARVRLELEILAL